VIRYLVLGTLNPLRPYNSIISYVEKAEGASGFYRTIGTEGSLDVTRCRLIFYRCSHFYKVVREGKEMSCAREQALSAMVVCEVVKRNMGSGEVMVIHGFEICQKFLYEWKSIMGVSNK
jgi:hypothetical protein